MFCSKLLPGTNLKNYIPTLFYQRRPSEAYLYYKMVSWALKKSLGKAIWI
jgi:hypothetical protein